jgi:uncharacterized protein (DUF1778 family)
MARAAQRPDRINLRLSSHAKRRLERAAAYSEKTLTDFVVDVALQKADTILQKQDSTTLTRDEWERFHTLLLDPPRQNERFRRAASEHKRTVRR